MRRKLAAPSTWSGLSLFARTPAVLTRQMSDSSSRLPNGVKGTQYRDNSSGFSTASPQLVERFHDLVGGRLFADGVDVDVADDAAIVDDEDGALRPALAAQHAIARGGVAVGPVFAPEGIREPAHGLGPRLVAEDLVDRDAQHLGIAPLELGEILLVRRHLHGSNRRERRRVEGEHHVLLSAVVAEVDLLARPAFSGGVA